jgi:hypothetical protein
MSLGNMRQKDHTMRKTLLLIVLASVASEATAQSSPCKTIVDDKERLACYDKAANRGAIGAGQGWELKGRQKAYRFVLINPEHVNNEETYRKAIANVCGSDRICTIGFWTDETKMAKKLPITPEQDKAQVADWSFNLKKNHAKLLWSCRAFPRKPKEDCF